MKKEVISEALGAVSDKHIEEASRYKASRGKLTAIAAAAAVVVLAVALAIVWHGAEARPAVSDADTPDNNIYINRDDVMVAVADMDIQIEWYDVNDLSSETADSFRERVGVSYSDFTAKIPEDHSVDTLCSYLSRWDEKGIRHEEYSPFDYRFEIGTPSGGRIKMAVCGVDEPLRDCIVKGEGAVPSEIDGVEMYIYETMGEYYVFFESGGIYYDIEAEVRNEEELVRFIESMI